MRVPLRWLHEYCRPGLDAAALADRLDMTGTKVERVVRHGVGDVDGFVVGRVLEAAAHRRAWQGHGYGLLGRDVGRAADDRAPAVSRLDLADAEAICVGMGLDRQHPADDEAIRRRRSDVGDALDLGAAQRHAFRQL